MWLLFSCCQPQQLDSDPQREICIPDLAASSSAAAAAAVPGVPAADIVASSSAVANFVASSDGVAAVDKVDIHLVLDTETKEMLAHHSQVAGDGEHRSRREDN